MARVLLYERAVDAICTNLDLICNERTQNGVKIKEEIEEDPVDATLNDNTIKNCMLVKNSSILSGSKPSLCENNISKKNKENELTANSYSAHLSNVNKPVNLKRKIVRTTEELVQDESSQPKKKRQSFKIEDSKIDEISKIGNTSNATKFKCNSTSFGTTIDSKKSKLKNVKKKKNYKKCDTCFRKFVSINACEQHKSYYDNVAKLKHHFIISRRVNKFKSTHRVNRGISTYLLCNFCNRNFIEKTLLQSHLFHIHNELIYSSNKVKQLNSRSKNNASIPQKNITLKTDTHEERSKNPVESEELNTAPRNDASKFKNDVLVKTKELNTEESSKKRLRQPTLTEYLEFCKKKCDKDNQNKLNIKNDLSMLALHFDKQLEENLKPTSSKDMKGESLSVESTNIPKRVTWSATENEKDDVSLAKKPFVKIHADVEMMKAFLDNLSDTVLEDNMNIDDTCKSNLSYRELPYSLRSSRVIPFVQTNLRPRNKSANVFKTQTNAGYNMDIEIEQNDYDFWKTSMVRLKDCIIPLTRCDKTLKNNQISMKNATFNTNVSPTVQRKSTSCQENNIRNTTALKELVVPLERLTIFPAVDSCMKPETTLDVKVSNNKCFLCKICKESFPTKLAKQIHIKSCHVAYMSSICNARYKRKRKLCEHYLQEHLFKLNQCCVCYVIFPNFAALEQHLTVHCIKYIQRKNDQYPIDKEIQCHKNKEVNKLTSSSHYNKEFSSLILAPHESHCVAQKKAEEEENNSLIETSTSENHISSEIVLKEHHNRNTDEISVVCDEKTDSVLCENLNNNSAEKSNEHQISVIVKNPVANNLLVREEIETANESQDSKKLPENTAITNKAIINDQDTAKEQLNILDSSIKIEICIVCGKQFHNHMKLQHHMRIFSNITDICTLCGTGFGSKQLLRSHITAAHVPQFSKNYTFHCMFCNQGFFKKPELRSHVLHLHGQEMLDTLRHDFQPNQEESDKSSITKCNVCHLEYETYQCYTEHMMYYYKNHIFTCSHCKKNFRGMYLFHHHYKLIHYSEDIRKSYSYICEICNEGFKHESHFYSHKMHVHLSEESSIEIGKEFREGSEFDHTLKIQQQKREFFTILQKQIEKSSYKNICQICNVKCTTANALMIHVANYSNDGPFQCNNCSRRCRTSTLLEEHIKATHTCRDIYNGHECSICGEVLKTSLSLKCHEKHFHSSNVNIANFCENCGQTFSTNIELKKHLCVFSNIAEQLQLPLSEDNYDCLFCDLNFSNASAVKLHIIQVHIDKLLAKHSVSKPSTVGNNQEQSIQQSEAFAPESSQSQLLAITQESNQIDNNWIQYMMEKKKKMAIKSSTQVKTDNLKTVSSESSNQVKIVLPESSNQIKAILPEPLNKVETLLSEPSNRVKIISSESSNQAKTVLPKSSNQIKTVFSIPSNQVKIILPELSNKVETLLSEPSNRVKIISSESSNQAKTVLSKSSNQPKTVLPKLSDQVKSIVLPESSSQVKTILIEPSNQVKTVLLESLNQVKVFSESPNQVKTALSKPPSQVKTILPESSNQVKTVTTKPPNQAEIVPFKSLRQIRIMKPSDNNTIMQKIVYHKSPHINGSEVQINTSMVAALNNIFKTITTASLPTGLTNSSAENNISSNSESVHVFQVNQTSLLNKPNNKSITLPSTSNNKSITLPSTSNTDESLNINEVVHKKPEKAVKGKYTCPLCSLVYPSLVFFHAHLNYAHAKSICKDQVNEQDYLSNLLIIKCLLCQKSSIFTDEEKYKEHLKNSHYVFEDDNAKVDNAKVDNAKVDSASNLVAQTNNNRKSITPEVITLDDDDIKDDSDKSIIEANFIPTIHPCKEQNDNKIGKLRVKSFAKIVENSTID